MFEVENAEKIERTEFVVLTGHLDELIGHGCVLASGRVVRTATGVKCTPL